MIPATALILAAVCFATFLRLLSKQREISGWLMVGSWVAGWSAGIFGASTLVNSPAPPAFSLGGGAVVGIVTFGWMLALRRDSRGGGQPR